MLGWFVSNTNVGQYALAARIMEAANFIPLILATYLFKFISNANLNSLKSFILIIRSYSFIFFWLGVITSLSLIIFSYYYFNMLEKNGFSFSLLLSTLLYPSFIFVSLGTFIGKLLLIKSLQQYIVYATITGAFINILLNLILIPTFGIFGAALSTIISYMISGLLFFIFFDKTRFVVVEMFKGVLLYQKSDKSYGK